MPPLDRAFAFAKVDGVAEPVGEHLDLHVSRSLDEALEVDRPVSERSVGLRAGLSIGLADLRLGSRHAHPLAAAAGGGLEQDRESHGLGRLDRGFGSGGRVGCARDDRYAGGRHGTTRLGLLPHDADGCGRRPDEGEAGLLHGLREVGPLGQKAVAGMNRVRPGLRRGCEQALDAQVGVPGW